MSVIYMLTLTPQTTPIWQSHGASGLYSSKPKVSRVAKTVFCREAFGYNSDPCDQTGGSVDSMWAFAGVSRGFACLLPRVCSSAVEKPQKTRQTGETGPSTMRPRWIEQQISSKTGCFKTRLRALNSIPWALN